MKNRIIEICELGQPQSIIHRENQPITELIKTDSLIEELNQQLRLLDVVKQSELLFCYHKGSYTLNKDGTCCKCHRPLEPKAK